MKSNMKSDFPQIKKVFGEIEKVSSNYFLAKPMHVINHLESYFAPPVIHAGIFNELKVHC